jgi:hypothetical protein
VRFFFGARSATAWAADAIARPIRKAIEDFLATTADGFVMQAGNQGDFGNAPMPPLHRFAASEPASLLLVEPIKQGVELSMVLHIRMIESVPTHRTPTLMTWLPCH